MQVALAYRGHSAITRSARALAVSLAPNLRRDRVGFAGVLRDPLRFREAVCALHDVVVSDLKFKPKDRTAYLAYLDDVKRREDAIRAAVFRRTKNELRATARAPMPPGLEARFHKLRHEYWACRDKYNDRLRREDPSLWRMLVPCDPVITVAPDVLFFECFSKDESSYGCLTVARDAFAAEDGVTLGTTNVDYSWALYDHFQELRSYRETRFRVDPEGFEVRTGADDGRYREEKIDLPPSWLRGFMMIQAAMAMPARKVPIGREALYSILAFLRRRRAKTSPRAVRFELTPGRPVAVVLEPWEKRIDVPGPVYEGGPAESIRTWGRDRLMLLYRLLPLIDSVDVHLLGTGLPSFWVVKMGPLRLTLGLSGWTANDWTSGGSALDQLAPPADPSPQLVGEIAAAFRTTTSLTFDQVRAKTGAAAGHVGAGLNQLARLGQVIHDLGGGVYRWRQVMPVAVSAALLGPEDPETAAARYITPDRVRVLEDVRDDKGIRHLKGKAEQSVELALDADGRILKAKCPCSFFYTGGLRKGPCRHLQAFRTAVRNPAPPAADVAGWFARFFKT